MRGAHPEHVAHVRDAGRVPAGNVRVEVLQVVEEEAHVGDARDVPVGDGAVRRNGGCRVSVDRLDRRLQGVRAREGVGVRAGRGRRAGRRVGRLRGQRRWRGRQQGRRLIAEDGLKHRKMGRKLGKIVCEECLGRVGGDLLQRTQAHTSEAPREHRDAVSLGERRRVDSRLRTRLARCCVGRLLAV
eukprot:scaffold57163_cov58-Phaeocystis_antarctica.AAC.2